MSEKLDAEVVNAGHRWYAIQTHAGSEMAVKRAIENIVRDNGIEEKLLDILVPTEDIIEVKNGKQKITQRCLYSGYVFAHIDLDLQLWHRIQVIPKVSRFIGEANKPAALSEKDVSSILEKANRREAPKPKISFENGESVRINEGPFANFTALVEEYDMIKGTLKLNVSIFGRSTPVEMSYSAVEKII